jgi:hypothetical protein
MTTLQSFVKTPNLRSLRPRLQVAANVRNADCSIVKQLKQSGIENTFFGSLIVVDQSQPLCGRVAELADAKDLGFPNRAFLVKLHGCF